MVCSRTGCSKRSSSKAAGSEGPEAYFFRYVEGNERLRTMLEAFFSIRQISSSDSPRNTSWAFFTSDTDSTTIARFPSRDGVQ